MGGGIAIGLFGGLLLAVTVTGNMNTFSAGEIVSASLLNENFASLRTAIQSTKEPPIGSIQAWHRDFANTPALPAGWVQCDGQTLIDSESPYDGQVIPDLNGTGRFIRGTSATSGTDQASQNLQHFHYESTMQQDVWLNRTYINWGNGAVGRGSQWAVDTVTGTPNPSSNQATSSAGGSEARPVNTSMVWIMRIK